MGYQVMQHRIFEGKNTIITGTASGIGLSSMEVFAENGAYGHLQELFHQNLIAL